MGLLKSAGIAVPEFRVASTKEQALEVAEELGNSNILLLRR